MRIERAKHAEDTRPQPKGLRLWAYWFVAVCVIPALFFLAVETGLRVFGYGYPMGFTFEQKVEGQKKTLSNPFFLWKYFDPHLIPLTRPFTLSATKPRDTYRIFLLGGSAARGTPSSAYSMAQILEKMLRNQYPTVNFEVVNTGRAAINSHVVVPIARTCSGLQSDLFVVYLGNNEVVGPYGAGTVFAPLTSNLSAIRASVLLKSSRIGQLIQNTIRLIPSRGDRPYEFQGMQMFADNHVRASDPRMETVYRHFEQNLSDICKTGKTSATPVIVATVGVNLKDSPPFGSMHRAGLSTQAKQRWQQLYQAGVAQEKEGNFREAVQLYLQAEADDADFADLQFQMGRCLWALEDFQDAKKRYEKARDLDTLRFRADTRVNEIIRRVAGGKSEEGIHLVDTVKVLETHSPHGIPGNELFYEHVHLNFAGNYQVAKSLFGQVQRLVPEWVRQRSSGRPVLSEQECMRQLAFSGWDRFKITKKLVTLMQRPPFTNQLSHDEDMERLSRERDMLKRYTHGEGLEETLGQYEVALRDYDAHWELLFQYAMLQLESRNNLEIAEKYLRSVVKQHPQFVLASMALGDALMLQKKYEVAMVYFEKALMYAPKSANMLWKNGFEHSKIGKFSKGIGYLKRAIKINPLNERAHYDLANALLRQKFEDPEHQKLAIEHYQKALEIDPDFARAHFNLAITLLKQKPEDPQHQKLAIEHYQKVLELAPEHRNVRKNLGLLYHKQADRLVKRNKLGEAKQFFEKALEVDPASARTHFSLANCLLRLNPEKPDNVESAIEHYQEVLKTKPDFAEAHYRLAAALFSLGDEEKAIHHFAEYMRLNPNDEKAQMIREQFGSRLSNGENSGDPSVQ